MILTFKQFISHDPDQMIFEGGNVIIDGEEAGSIDLEKHDRKVVVDLIKKSLTKLNSQFKLKNGLYLWDPKVLKDNLIFSGSTKHLFDEGLIDDELKKHKSKFGDVDTMIDFNLKEQLRDYFDKQTDGDYGSLEFIGYKPSGDQLISLWKFKKYKINIQIDFEGVEFKDGEPSEWSHFSHSSPFEDLVNGIKGAFHKLLLTSLMAPKKVEAVEQMKTKQKDIIAGTHSLSIKGMREKYKIVGHNDDGKPIMVDTKSKDFVTDFIHIFREVFGKYPEQDADVKKFWSFKGMLELIKKYMDLNEREEVIKSFVEKLFGDAAQSLYRNDNNRDMEEKMQALNYLSDMLNVDINNDKLVSMQEVYYKKNK